MTEKKIKTLNSCIAAIALLLLIFTSTHATDLIFEKGDGEIIIIVTPDGDILSSVEPIENNIPTSTGDLIFYNPNDQATSAKCGLSPGGINIKRNLEKAYVGDFPATAIKIDHEATTEHQAAVTTDGDLLIRGGTTSPGYKNQPSFIRTSTFQAPGGQKAIISTQYFDGIGNFIQTALRINSTTSIVSGTYFDAIGRKVINTKSAPFITNNRYYPMDGDKLINDVNAYYRSLHKLDSDDNYAYSQTTYYNDPLGHVNAAGAPGKIYSLADNHHSEYFYYGVESYSDFATISEGPGGIPWIITNPAVNPRYFLTVTKDPNGNFIQKIMDISGNVVSTLASTGTEDVLNQNFYDILGNLVEQIPSGQTNLKSTYEYNTLGQLIKRFQPDVGFETNNYDDAGRLYRKVKAAGCNDQVELLYTYDNLGRLIRTVADEKAQIRNYYDNTEQLEIALNGMINYSAVIINEIKQCNNLKGNCVGSIKVGCDQTGVEYIDSSIVELFTYDDEGRILGKYKYIPQLGWQKVSFDEYDIQGKVIRTTTYPKYPTPTGDNYLPITMSFEYDNLGRLLAIYKNNATVNRKLVSYAYDDLGRIKSKSFYNATGSSIVNTVTYDCNIREWPTKVQATNAYTEDISYAGNFNGNISVVTHIYPEKPPYNLTYTYDHINRLVSVETDDEPTRYREAFRYDNIGRIRNKLKNVSSITESRPDDYIYYPNTNRLKQVADIQTAADNYLYDSRGNMIQDKFKKMTTVTYDWRDMPLSFAFYINNIVSPNNYASRVEMQYDAGGNRVVKREFNMTAARAVIYGEGGTVFENENITSSDPNLNKWVLKYSTFAGGRIDYASQTACYYLTDHLGSIRSVISDLGDIAEAYMYDAYGMEYPIIVPSTDETREKFTGKELDQEGAVPRVTGGMGLYYFGARYYDPAIGRWTSCDLARQFVNPYLYNCNPLSFFDPNGLTSIWVYVAHQQYVGTGILAEMKMRFEDLKLNYNVTIIYPGSSDLKGYTIDFPTETSLINKLKMPLKDDKIIFAQVHGDPNKSLFGFRVEEEQRKNWLSPDAISAAVDQNPQSKNYSTTLEIAACFLKDKSGPWSEVKNLKISVEASGYQAIGTEPWKKPSLFKNNIVRINEYYYHIMINEKLKLNNLADIQSYIVDFVFIPM